MDPYISVQWMQMSLDREHVKDSIYRDEEFKTTRVFFIHKSGSTKLNYEKYAIAFDMPEVASDCNNLIAMINYELQTRPTFVIELETIHILQL